MTSPNIVEKDSRAPFQWLTLFHVPSMFAVLFIVSIVASIAAAKDRLRPADSADTVRPVAVGEPAPGFTVATVEGQAFHFLPGALDRPAILISFRGGWCPYCNMHLSELRHTIPAILGMGIDVLFLSGDRPDRLYQSLGDDTQQYIDGLGYRIYSDADASAALALGIAFRASDRTIERRRQKGEDIEDSSMAKHRILSVPAVIAVDADGIVSYVFADADYKVRLPADDLLAVAARIADR